MTTQGASARGDARRTEILRHTQRLIAERGYRHVRVADIAEVCGTSTGAIHYHFPKLEDVLQASLEYCFAQAALRQSEVLARLDSSRERFIALIEMQLPAGPPVSDEWSIWVQVWAESRVNERLRAAHHTYYQRWYGSVVGLIVRGQRAGEFIAGDSDELARRFTVAVDGAGMAVLTGTGSLTIADMRRMLLAIVDSFSTSSRTAQAPPETRVASDQSRSEATRLAR